VRRVAALAPVLLALAAGVAAGYPAPPRVLVAGQHPYSSQGFGYLLYAPAAYAQEPRRRWPLIVFLHGSGERGTDPVLVAKQPLPKTLATTTTFPAVVLSPQLAPPYAWWSDAIGSLDRLVRRVEARYRIDPHRVYLTGLSLGGFGTWHYALDDPGRFAALVPIAGGYVQGSRQVPSGICRLRNTPIWAFAGTADTIVYPYQSEVLVDALRACGSKVVRFTLYRGVDHFGTWPRAYAEPALWRWLFAQRRR
jgi:predicted peptidase